MRNIWTIVKKELARVFTDKTMIFSLFILPPLTMYLIYGLMGMSAKNEAKKINAYTPIVYVVNAPDTFTNNGKQVKSFSGVVEDYKNLMKLNETESLVANAGIHYINESEFESAKTKLQTQEIDLIIYFPADFIQVVKNDDATNKPQVEILYNIDKSYSESTYYGFVGVMSQYENSIAATKIELEKLNIFNEKVTDLGDTEKAQGRFLGMFIPMILIIYLFTGAMSVGMESVAGEKERGTIATLLVTPIKRSELAVGKIISISVIAVLSSIASFIGLVAVMPQFNEISGDENLFGGLKYQISDYLMLFGIMFVSVLLFVGLVVVVSTFSKTTKQAGALVTPLMLIVMGISFFNMFNMEVSQNPIEYLLPVYNIVLVLKAIFQFNITFVNWLLAVFSTCIYIGLLVLIIQRMFKSEKIMFSR
ncbi:MAG: ABC transporter permease [Bacilli bacterium]|nr:ABC transporter permease [Bacilli bacterium]